jgi:predicted DCC family thiol-disulfide oxidoreductase YuxK
MDTLKVFYDGKCHLCFREVMHYKKRDSKNVLELIDISHSTFNAADYGLDEDQVNLHMHAMDASQNVYKGVDSFVEIWRRIPPYSLLISIVNNSLLRPGFNLSYEVFARYIRPRLPKRQCDDDACQVHL